MTKFSCSFSLLLTVDAFSSCCMWCHCSSFPFQAGHVFSLRFMTLWVEWIITMEQDVEKRGGNLHLVQWLDRRGVRVTGTAESRWMGSRVIVGELPAWVQVKTLCCLSAGLSACQKWLHKTSCFPSDDGPDDQSECQDAVRNYRTNVGTEQQSREPVRFLHVTVSLEWWLTSCGLEKH